MKTTHTFSVSSTIRRHKSNKHGEAPVYIRITVNKESVEISTKHYINPKSWDGTKGRVTGKTDKSKAINETLASFEHNARTQYNRLLAAGMVVTAAKIKLLLLGNAESSHTLLSLFDQMVSNIKALVGQEYTESTYKNYLASQKHIHYFVKAHLQLKDIALRELNYKFITEYELYLKTIGGCTQNGCIKHMQKLRKVITMALHHEYLDRDPFISYSIRKKKTVVQPLTKHELQSIAKKEFDTDRLNIIRDMFLFTSYTGLAFGDAAALSSENIGIGIDGESWIFISRKKTGTLCRIPLLTPAKVILAKYQGHPKVVGTGKLLPIPSNQKFNAYLKEIADVCGITKRLTVHIGRHTFATTIALQNGIPMEVVKEILGHDSILTTQIYAKVTDDKIADTTRALRVKLAE